MTQQAATPILSFNNDRMAAHTAFRSSSSTFPPQMPNMIKNDLISIGQAAPAITSTAAPKPTQLDDQQAEVALEQVQQNAGEVLTAHNGIDPERVARLLSLLD